ncbi:MAG: hypothetical protein K9I94_13965 [Bacteroidales bacterium]|nr:hypothetical protein [Bacteroidales bacterium]
MEELNYIILLPVIAGIILFILPEKVKMLKGILSLIIAGITGYFAYMLYVAETGIFKGVFDTSEYATDSVMYKLLNGIEHYWSMNLDSLSQLIVLFIAFFSIIILIYSITSVKREKKLYNFYSYFLITLGCAFGAVLADNLIMFVVFWGILGLTLYKLIKGYDEESSAAANKTLILIAASDVIMIVGIGLVWVINGSYSMSAMNVSTTSGIGVMAFLTLLVGSFTKAGAFPFHTWVPAYAQKAPAASSAYLPASLDKLLGIYFLARLCKDLFVLNEWLTLVLMVIGVVTIIAAVMMALVQHNYKKLLGYHAVSQVGYMIVGFGLGTALGIAAGLFHMINNALYKSGLFLSAGTVEDKTGKENLEDLGGLSKAMPITFFATFIFALSISGIPPLNGFASKWMIYQGIIDFGKEPGIANQLWIIWLALAVLGSALTLASFVKFTSGIFMGQPKEQFKNLKETNFMGWFPMVILAIVCIGFGVVASSVVVPGLFEPIVGPIEYIGIWQSSLVGGLILISIVVGLLIYWIGNFKNFRTVDTYIGGETAGENFDYPSPGFYGTIQNAPFFSVMYKAAEKRWFDVYNLTKSIVLSTGNALSRAQNGILTNYIIWLFVGLLILLIILM